MSNFNDEVCEYSYSTSTENFVDWNLFESPEERSFRTAVDDCQQRCKGDIFAVSACKGRCTSWGFGY